MSIVNCGILNPARNSRKGKQEGGNLREYLMVRLCCCKNSINKSNFHSVRIDYILKTESWKVEDLFDGLRRHVYEDDDDSHVKFVAG